MKEFTLPQADVLGRALWGRVPKETRVTFFSAFVLGLITHLYMITNKFPNHDDINHLFANNYGTQSGRWVLPYISKWSGDFSMPWVIGLLSILFLSLGACLVVALFRVKKPLYCVLISALMVSFPAVTSTFTYMFTADAYFFGLLLAIFGAYTTVRHPYIGVSLGAFTLILSMSIYQSYFPVAVALVVGALLFDTLAGDRDIKMLLGKGVRVLAVLMVSMGGYLLAAKLTTDKVGLVDYMGIDKMGKLEMDKLPELIGKCYSQYKTVFIDNKLGIQFDYLGPLLAVAFVATIALLGLILWQRHLGAPRTVLAVVLAVLYPLSANLIHIMVGGEKVHMLMIYGMVMMLVMPLALASYAAEHSDGLSVNVQNLRTVLCWVVLVTMALTSCSYALTDNKAYLKTQIAYEQCSAYANRLVSAIEQTEGYQTGMPVVFIGNRYMEANIAPLEPLKDKKMTGASTLYSLRSNYSFGSFLKYYMAFYGDVYLDTSDIAKQMAGTATVAEMPCYPTDGSIQKIDGYLVVKFNP